MDPTGFDDVAPSLAPGAYVFDRVVASELSAVLTHGAWVALVRETEGITVVRPATEADTGQQFARITLGIESGLDWVGLTARVSTALAGAGIACNVLAGSVHDHLFVPAERAQDAMRILAGREEPL